MNSIILAVSPGSPDAGTVYCADCDAEIAPTQVCCYTTDRYSVYLCVDCAAQTREATPNIKTGHQPRRATVTASDMIRETEQAIASGATCATCAEYRTCPWAGDVPCSGYKGG